MGCKTRKLAYGNRGHNQPCVHADTGRCFMTSQNHGYEVDAATIPKGWRSLISSSASEFDCMQSIYLILYIGIDFTEAI